APLLAACLAAARRAGLRHADLHHPDRLDSRRLDHRPRRRAAPAGQPCGGELRLRLAPRRRRPLHRLAGLADDAEQHDHGALHRRREDRHLPAFGLCGRLLQLPRADDRLLDHLHDADAARRGAHHPDLPGHRQPRPVQLHGRPDHSADRIGDGDAALPPVLPHHPGRVCRGGEDGRCQPDALLPRHPAAALGDEHRGPLRHPLHLWLEPVSLAPAGGERPQPRDDRRRHGEDDRQRRRAERMERHHGDGGAGAAAARRSRHLHAALVPEGPDGDREV
ncbi:MAG: Glycerol-3-phosphate ABC transporter, permease protein UgpE, partial [uncultured Craurococcus sp.]